MIRFALIVASVLGFALTAALGNLMVPMLRELERGPAEPEKQQNVPTMGGLCLMVGMLAAVGVGWVAACIAQPQLLGGQDRMMSRLLIGLFGSLAFGGIGLADDLARLRSRSPLGLRRAPRLALEAAAAAAVLGLLALNGCLPTGFLLPGGSYVQCPAAPVLAGLLLELQEQAFEYLRALEVGGAELAPIAEFVEKRLCVKLPADYDSALLRAVLDRPIRVCGMVRNEGEPGGGPFWVGNPDGTQSLQIAESSQISPDDMPLMKQATHFNPVDLVCGVRDSKGRKFDLRRYTDPSTGFISSKSSGGRPLRAQELPGLWNGAMARWNTVFVDVPITTFSPVKVVQDLLRPQHQ